MNYGIISDIHGNLEALESVLNHLDILGVKQIVNLGDSVGYGSSPNEYLSLLRKKKVTSIMGNHDETVFNDTLASTFNQNAQKSIDWTRKTISESNLAYLKSLPENYSIDNLLFIHGALTSRFKYGYIVDLSDCQVSFNLLERNSIIYFFGHTHREFFSSSI